jgi:transposase
MVGSGVATTSSPPWHAQARRLSSIPGICIINATALLAAVGDASAFAKGRDLAAWLGLTPRQHSTGGRTKMLGISKRGNRYLRKQLVHGARAALLRRERPHLRSQSGGDVLPSHGIFTTATVQLAAGTTRRSRNGPSSSPSAQIAELTETAPDAP